MWIKNVKILTNQGEFVSGMVRTKGERISRVFVLTEDCFTQNHIEQMTKNEPEEPVIDGEGGYLFPGMIDMHIHGALGADFCDGTLESLDTIARFEASIGVTAIAPATMTLPQQKLLKVLENAGTFQKRQDAQRKHAKEVNSKQADLVGIHMEGPFISPVKKGAQDAAHIIPRSSEIFREFQEAAGGLVRIIAIAPEEDSLESVETFIRKVDDLAVVALAHTNADYDTARLAFEQGASHAVHLFNGMPVMHHRNPGAAGAALDTPNATTELICDGVHIHPAMIRLVFGIKERGKVILVSDSMRAAGLSDGNYTLGGQDVLVKRNHAQLMSDGSLAGSVTTLPDCVRYVSEKANIPLGEAILASTLAPAIRLGIDGDYGSVAEGKLAELVLWDQCKKLKMVIHRGRQIV